MSQQITIPSAGDTLATHYRIDAEIGRGAYGVVFRAKDTRTGDILAIKTLLPQSVLDMFATERFSREAQLVSRLHHENLIQLHDYGQSDGLFYMAVEFVEGRSLAEFLESETPVSPERAFAIVKQILSALDHAHDLGIVHRDLKPANILLKAADPMANRPYETVKILDFGIAKLVQGDGEASKTLTQNGHVLGTPHYMAPEQISGDDITHHADLYAVGIILYELLTGRHPYKATSPTAVMIAHLHDAPDELPHHLRHSKWSRALDLALAKQPFDRVKSAQDFLELLEQKEAPQVHFPGGSGETTKVYTRPTAEDLATQLYKVDEQSLLDDASPQEDFEADPTRVQRLVKQDFGALPSPVGSPDPPQAPLKRPTHPTQPPPAHRPPVAQGHIRTQGAAKEAGVAQKKGAGRFVVALLGVAMIAAVLWLFVLNTPTTGTPTLEEAKASPINQPVAPVAIIPEPEKEEEEPDAGQEIAAQAPDSEPIHVIALRHGNHTVTKALGLAQMFAEAAPEPAKNLKQTKQPVKKKPAKVTFTITSSPSGARVSVGGRAIGVTPMSHSMERGGKAVEVSVSLHGFEPMDKTEVPDRQKQVNFTLKKKRLGL